MNFDDIDDDTLIEFAEKTLQSTQHPSDDSKESQPNPEHMDILLKYFGHKTFRPMQWEIISAIIHERRDICAIMSTGYGKSLCFQYPSTFLGGLTLVISPLISLMEDQVLSLKVSNIPACLLGTAQINQKQVLQDIFDKKYSMVYLTPEFCTGDFGSEILKRMAKELNIVLIAIDEAHCISTWGHDFRFQYRNLGLLHETFPSVPVIAVTATATSQVKADIIKSLKLHNPLVVCSGFDRSNLYFEVHQKSSLGFYSDLSKVIQLGNIPQFDGPTIIYCITRKETEELTQILRSHGMKCAPYHAGLPLKVRQETHEKFVRDQIDVIVATIAFGMGIDKPDIRNIVHYGASRSIESYYQEVGRAGRDGQPARCTAFYSSADFRVLQSLEERTGNSSSRQQTHLKLIEEYLGTRQCRRRFILSYFGDKTSDQDEPQKSCCDNCTKRLCDTRSDHEKYEGVDKNGFYDFTNDARLLLRALSILRPNYGLNIYILFLRGSKSARIPESLHMNPVYGAGKDKSEEWWKALARILIQNKYLQETRQKTSQGFGYSAISLSAKGSNMLSTAEKILLPPPSTIVPFLKKKSQQEGQWLAARINSQSTVSKTTTPNEETEAEIKERMTLYHKLLNRRTELAARLDCMPYMVATNAALMTLSRLKPKTLDELCKLNLDGFTEAKVVKFGASFLELIPGADVSTKSRNRSIKDILVLHPLPQASLPLTAEVTYTMFKSGLTLGEIAVKRGVTASTITSHLISCIKSGQPVKIVELGVSYECRDVVVKAFRRLCPTGFRNISLTAVKNECPGDVSYDQIRTVLAYVEVRTHLESLAVDYEEFEDFKFNEVDQRLDALIDYGNKLEDDDFYSLPTQKASNDEDASSSPPSKREKMEVEFSDILDSPPRRFAGCSKSAEPNVKTEDKTHLVQNEDSTLKKNEEVKNVKISNGKKVTLPSWLVVKRN